MDLRRAAGAFLAILGGLMIAVWGVLLAMDQVPEVHTALVSLALLLAAEMTTAVLSVVRGAALVTRKAWAHRSYPVASGKISKTPALREEADEPDLLSKPRIVFAYDRGRAGRLNEMILAINRLGRTV